MAGESAEGLIEDILAEPENDARRLIYADWLEEHGDADRANFIRAQIALTIRPENDPERSALRTHADKLLRKHRAEWEAPLRALGAEEVAFCRGLPEGVRMTAKDFVQNADAIHALAPIQRADLQEAEAWIDDLAACPHLSRLTHLDLDCHGFRLDTIPSLLHSSHLTNLTHLAIHGGFTLTNDEVMILAESPNLRSLTSLDLAGNIIGPDGVQALAASPHLANLTHLDLSLNYLGPEGARELAESKHLTRLVHLEVEGSYIGDEGVAALAGSKNATHFSFLNLAHNNLHLGAAQALAASPHLTSLAHLDVGNNYLGDEGAQALLDSPLAARQTFLDLGNNGLSQPMMRRVERWRQERGGGRATGR